MAATWEKYAFITAQLVYTPSAPATVGGSAIAYFDMDATDNPTVATSVSSLQNAAFNHEGARMFNIYHPMTLNFSIDMQDPSVSSWFTGTDISVTTSQARVVVVAMNPRTGGTTGSGGNVVGTFSLAWSIQFINPQISPVTAEAASTMVYASIAALYSGTVAATTEPSINATSRTNYSITIQGRTVTGEAINNVAPTATLVPAAFRPAATMASGGVAISGPPILDSSGQAANFELWVANNIAQTQWIPFIVQDGVLYAAPTLAATVSLSPRDWAVPTPYASSAISVIQTASTVNAVQVLDNIFAALNLVRNATNV
jgi:hypothetical protein